MKLSVIAAATLAIAGCASAPPPPAESYGTALGTAQTAARLGAASDADAYARLSLARREIESATALARLGKNDEAARTIVRANADAELALELTRATLARARARNARAALEQAREGR